VIVALIVATAGVGVVLAIGARESQIAAPSPSATPTAAPSPSGIAVTFTTGTATPTCRVLPTPNYGPEPPHAPVNGQPTIGAPTLSGVILVRIPQCRDIQQILSKYGLPGPATRYIDVAESDEMIANGATRWFRVQVTPGTEAATVVELYRHPEDIEYVQLLPEFQGGVARA
jgi:hypothetical protein